MKPITVKMVQENRTLVLKSIAAAFIVGAVLTVLLATNSGTTHANGITATPVPTATVSPMVVGQPMMLMDAAGNSIVIMQGSTFYIFPKQPATPSPKP